MAYLPIAFESINRPNPDGTKTELDGMEAIEFKGIKDLGRFVYDQLGLKVNLCEEPESTVVMGLGAIIEDPHLAKLTL